MMRMPRSPNKSSSLVIPAETKNPIQILVFSCACHIIRALGRAKSFVVKTAREKLYDLFQIQSNLLTRKHSSSNRKVYLGSFRFHYNFFSSSSSHIQPFPENNDLYYYDPTWDSMILMDEDCAAESGLSKYLQWLEEKKGTSEESNDKNGANITREGSMGEIDKLAKIFIAKCHEMFILEKQESYRRFQEMISI